MTTKSRGWFVTAALAPWGRPLALPLYAILLSSLVAAPLHARPRAFHRATDSNYISALAAANHFLHAWQNQDRETGIAMLTDTIKHQTSEDRLQSFFSSGSEAAYEIARGKRMKTGRYVFPITLFDPRTTPRPRCSRIVIIRAGKDDWAVDQLP
ncbi:MAG: hypothetical protein DMG88_05075 [Acidobacteria bacterium]|nr:MAG: hypothetical protein DMG88_05075 [Acidobacteriota bacterium]